MFSISQDLTLQGISGISRHFYCVSINPQHKIFLIKLFLNCFYKNKCQVQTHWLTQRHFSLRRSGISWPFFPFFFYFFCFFFLIFFPYSSQGSEEQGCLSGRVFVWGGMCLAFPMKGFEMGCPRDLPASSPCCRSESGSAVAGLAGWIHSSAGFWGTAASWRVLLTEQILKDSLFCWEETWDWLHCQPLARGTCWWQGRALSPSPCDVALLWDRAVLTRRGLGETLLKWEWS